MKIEYSKQAVKTIKNIDRQTKQYIKIAIENVPIGDINPLKDSKNSYMLSIGDWRIIFSYPTKNTVQIEKIAPRGKVYKECKKMSPIRKQLDDMINCLPEQEQLLLFEVVKRFVPDDVATATDLEDIQSARTEYARGETVSHENIDWN